MSKTYRPVFGHVVDAAGANDICQSLYNGSLASVTTQFVFDGIHAQLKAMTSQRQGGEIHQTFWTCGKVTSTDADMLGVVGLRHPPSFQQGASAREIG